MTNETTNVSDLFRCSFLNFSGGLSTKWAALLIVLEASFYVMETGLFKHIADLFRGATTPIAALMLLAFLMTWMATTVLDSVLPSAAKSVAVFAGMTYLFLVTAFVAFAVRNCPQDLTYDKDAHIRTREINHQSFEGLEVDEPWDSSGPLLDVEQIASKKHPHNQAAAGS